MRAAIRGGMTVITVLAVVAAAAPVRAQPPYLPEFDVSASPSHVDRLSQLTVETAQKDFEDLIRDYRVEIAPGWRFAVAGVSPSNFATCAAAASPGVPRYSNSNTQAINNMEAIGTVALHLATDDTRESETQVHTDNATQPNPGGTVQNPTGTDEQFVSSEGAARYDGGGFQGPQGRPEASLWFLRWEEATSTAILCATVRTANLRIPPAQREVIFQIELTLRPDGSWLMRWDLDAAPGAAAGFRSVTDSAVFLDLNVAVTYLRITIGQTTGGRFNTNCPNAAGGTCRVDFSFTPAVAGTYPVEAELGRCPAEAASCALQPAMRLVNLLISEPSQFDHTAAVLTGPGAAAGIPTGFGLVREATSATIPWTQPATLPFDSVRGYVLTVARPHDQTNRHFEYIVTDPASPAFDPREPCGPDGAAEECSVKVNFPLGSAGQDLLGEGKYSVALTTVYQDGHRTDGRCDDGTAEGASCGGGANFPIVAPGVSTWEFFITRDAWPDVFIERQEFFPTGQPPTARFSAPAYLLLLDYPRQRAEFVIWNPGSEARTYFGGGSTVQGLSGGGGVVGFSSTDVVGPSPPFRFMGYTVPSVEVVPSPQRVPPGCVHLQLPPATFAATSSQACGVFVTYDLRGLPAVPNGVPTARVEIFEGLRL